MSKKQVKLPRIVLMDCVVVGGCADGLLLRGVRADAKFIQLERPMSVKPLVHSLQKDPTIVYESDVYEVHPIHLVDSAPNAKPVLYGIAVVKSEQLTWAFNELLKNYVIRKAEKSRTVTKPH